MDLSSVNQRIPVPAVGVILCVLSISISISMVALSIVASPTQAQSAAAKSDGYEQAIRMGIQEYKFGNWLEAKAYFSQAHALHPNARTLRGLAMVSYELRAYVEAVQKFRAALANPERPLTPKMRKDAQRFLKQAANFVAYLQVRSQPEIAKMTVDGRPPTVGDDGRWMLNPGGHELVVSAPGYQVVTRKVRVVSGSNPELNIRLDQTGNAQLPKLKEAAAAVAGTTPGKVADAPAGIDDGSWSTRRWVAVGLGAGGVVGLGVSGLLSALALDADGSSEPNCESNDCNTRGSTQREDALALGNGATVSIVAGGVLLAGAAVLFFTEPEERSSDSGPAADVAVTVSPWIGTELGLQIRGLL